MARRAEQTRRLANCTHIKLVHKPHATQRLAISRVRHDGTNTIERESVPMPPDGKIAQTKHVGCMAVLGCTELVATNERRTIRERAVEIGLRRLSIKRRERLP